MKYQYYKDKRNGLVYAYDENQMSYVKQINDPDFSSKDEIPAVYFEIDKKIKSMKQMSDDEYWLHINPPVSKEQQIAEAEAKKQHLLSEATETIAPLQDAVDLDMATPEEEAPLKEWKKYRVMLNRVDTSLGADAVWPMPPV